MPIQQKDFILRLIEELGASLRQLRAALMGGGASAGPAVVEQAVAAQGELLGALAPVLQSVDAATAASLVTDTRRLRLWAELMAVEAEGRRLMGQTDLGDELARRAAALLHAAKQREP